MGGKLWRLSPKKRCQLRVRGSAISPYAVPYEGVRIAMKLVIEDTGSNNVTELFTPYKGKGWYELVSLRGAPRIRAGNSATNLLLLYKFYLVYREDNSSVHLAYTITWGSQMMERPGLMVSSSPTNLSSIHRPRLSGKFGYVERKTKLWIWSGVSEIRPLFWAYNMWNSRWKLKYVSLGFWYLNLIFWANGSGQAE